MNLEAAALKEEIIFEAEGWCYGLTRKVHYGLLCLPMIAVGM